MTSGENEEEETFLLAAVRQAVARTSIRAVAKESGMSHGAIYNLATGRTRRVYGKTIGKLRDWYLRQWASGGDGLTPEVAVYLVEQVIAVVWPGERVGAALELVRALERIYDGHTTPRPAWLSVVREEYRSR